MSNERLNQLRVLEGWHVSVALRDGSRIDDCQLVSVGRSGVSTVWLFVGGRDVFLSFNDLVDVWEIRPAGARRAA
jgi:hypothetical protein